MVEEATSKVMKVIPSKGTRLSIMIIVEFLAIVWAFYVMYNAPELAGENALADYAAFHTDIFNSWAEFTIWNVGTYAASETVVKGGESVLNRE